jgi:hypothetical protein
MEKTQVRGRFRATSSLIRNASRERPFQWTKKKTTNPSKGACFATVKVNVPRLVPFDDTCGITVSKHRLSLKNLVTYTYVPSDMVSVGIVSKEKGWEETRERDDGWTMIALQSQSSVSASTRQEDRNDVAGIMAKRQDPTNGEENRTNSRIQIETVCCRQRTTSVCRKSHKTGSNS